MNIAVYITVLFCLLHTGQALLPVCPQVKCRTVCKEYALDKNGCQTCNCKECQPVLCKLYCPHGWAVNENGCEICKCRSCEPVRCRMYCKYGWDVDEHGCEICKCKVPCDGEKPLQGKDGNNLNCGRGGERCPANSFCDIHPTDRYAVCCRKCEPVLCKLKCPYGYDVDEIGCEICKCRWPCDGEKPLQGKDGNNLNCGRGGEPCPANSFCDIHPTDRYAVCCPKCSPVLCKMYCEHGFQVGKDGCEICSCRPCPKGVDLVACLKNPCDGATCANGLGKTCKANYCGSCNAVWYNSNNQVVNCNTKG